MARDHREVALYCDAWERLDAGNRIRELREAYKYSSIIIGRDHIL